MVHRIQAPPALAAPSQELGQRFFTRTDSALQRAVEAADSAKGYLHWDQFRYREPAAGLSQEELWGLIQWLRISTSRPLPLLLQKSGRPFSLSTSGPMAAALHRIDTKEVLWKQALGPSAGEARDDTYRLMAAIEEAHHSSAIEGAVTTRRESRDLIRTGRPPKSRSEQMVLNNYRALERLDEWKELPLAPELICEVQATVTEEALDDPDDQGVVRTDDEVRIHDAVTGEVVYQPPPASELTERLDALCRFANETPRDEDFLSPITRAILIHHQVSYDHPFADGNGRTARMLFMWSMLRSGYHWLRAMSISRAVHLDRTGYYRSFQYVQLDSGDVTYFVRHQLRCIEKEIKRLADFLEDRQRVATWMRDRKAIASDLNARQLALVDCALRNPDATFTVREHREFHAVTQPTAWKDLQDLVSQDLLTESRIGRKAVYGASEKLKQLSRERPD